MKDRVIKMHEIDVDLDQKTIDGLCKYALKEIKKDSAGIKWL